MRRRVLVGAIERVLDDLRDSGLVEMLTQGVQLLQRSAAEKEEKDWISLSSITNYVNRVARYSETEEAVLEILNLTELGDPNTWQPNLRRMDPDFIFISNSKVRAAITFLPKIIDLLGGDYADAESELVGVEPEVHIQTVILGEEGGSLSSSQRLIELLSAIQGIYSLIAEVDGVTDASIAVVGMDSGSEKSFDFLGIARFMHELREALQSVYNVVAFHKQNVTLKNLQVAGETLSVVQKISKLQQSEAITNEEAQRMRHSLFSNLEKFSNTGAFTPEMDAPHQPSAMIMRPQPRLLTGPIDELVRQANDDPSNEEPSKEEPIDVNSSSVVSAEEENREFTREQIASAIQLLKQTQAAPPKKPKPNRKQTRRTRPNPNRKGSG